MSSSPPQPARKLPPRRLDAAPAILTAQPQATDATATDPTIIANAAGTGSTAPFATVIDLAAIRTNATVASGPAVSGAAGCSEAAASGAAGAGPSSMHPRSFNWGVTNKFLDDSRPTLQQNRQSAGSDPMDTTSSMDTNSDHIASPGGTGS